MVTEVRLVQPSKAELSMLVTDEGMLREGRPVQPEKAPLPMLETDEGIFVLLHPFIRVLLWDSIIALQLLRESYLGFPSATMIEIRDVQPMKAQSSMLVTEEEMDTEFIPLQSLKALSPMLVTLSPMI